MPNIILENPPATPIKIFADHGRIPELDGFRALAVWLVVVHHAFYAFPFRKDLWANVPSIFVGVVKAGWLGVDLFFVLSGFLISGILIAAKPKSRYFRNFYGRRVLRIMPLYFTVVIVMYASYPSYGSYFLLSSAFLANFAGYFHVGIPHAASIFWSLAIEEHFYLIWPLVIWMLSRKQVLCASAAIVVLTPLLRGISVANGMDPEGEIYVYSWFRFDGLALGAFLAAFMADPDNTPKRTLRLATAFAAIAVTVTIVGTPFGLMGTKTVVSTALRYTQVQMIYAAAIGAALALRGQAVTTILRSKFARVSSDYSYCLYLIHLGVGVAYMSITAKLGWNTVETFGDWGSVLLRAAVIIGVSFMLAALSKRFLEDPFLRLKRYFV